MTLMPYEGIDIIVSECHVKNSRMNYLDYGQWKRVSSYKDTEKRDGFLF
mgnify:CR=1 FL=1